MKFKIDSLNEAMNAVPKNKQTFGFINIFACIKKLIKKGNIEEEFFIDYVHSLARIVNNAGNSEDAEIVELNNGKMLKLARINNLNIKELKNFLIIISEAIYKSRYERIEGECIEGEKLDYFEEYNNRFNEKEWLKKHKMTF